MGSKDDERLFQIAAAEGWRRGIEVSQATFRPFKEFSFRWTADGSVLEVSDYLDHAPDAALRDLLRYTYSYIALKRQRRPTDSLEIGPDYMAYATSDDFLLDKRPVFLKRSRNLKRSDVGQYRNIFDAAQRLLDMGLLTADDLDNTYFTWTSEPNYTRLGYCAQMFRVVAISSVMDDPGIPEYVFDHVVYHECLHLRQGYRPFDSHPHDAEFHRQEKLYPRYRESSAYMKLIPLMGRAAKRRRPPL